MCASVCRYRERVRELNELFALHDGVDIPAGALTRPCEPQHSSSSASCSHKVFSCNSPWALRPHHARGGFLASLVVVRRPHESRARLHNVRCACFRSTSSVHVGWMWSRTSEGTATKSGLRNPPIKNSFIVLSCGADQCGFNHRKKQDNYRLE